MYLDEACTNIWISDHVTHYIKKKILDCTILKVSDGGTLCVGLLVFWTSVSENGSLSVFMFKSCDACSELGSTDGQN